MNNNIIKFDKARFTVLTEQLIRIEYSHTGEFEDGMTQMIQNRDFPEVKFDFIKKEIVGILAKNLLEIWVERQELWI